MLQELLMLTLDDVETAHPGADVYAHTVRVFRRDFQATHLHRLISRGHGQVDEAAHLLYFFFFDEIERIEAFDFSGNLAGKPGGIEVGDPGDPTFAGHNVFPD